MNDMYTVFHKINFGDTLYNLSIMYNTTVEDIMNANPGIMPHNLLVGQIIAIPQGYREEMLRPSGGMAPMQPMPQPAVNNNISKEEFELSKKMRLAWSQHVYWTRLLIISIVNELKDTDAATNRVLRTAKDISDLFRPYFGDAAGDALNKLLTEHLVIGADLIKATKNNDAENIARLNSEWYKNADEMAEEFSKLSPYYDKETVRKMLHRHLDLTKEELANRIAGRYADDVNSFNKVEQEAMMMADYFVDGMMSD